MPRLRLVTAAAGALRGLAVTLLQIQLALTEPVAANAVSSILSEANRTVPEYVTRYGTNGPSVLFLSFYIFFEDNIRYFEGVWANMTSAARVATLGGPVPPGGHAHAHPAHDAHDQPEPSPRCARTESGQPGHSQQPCR